MVGALSGAVGALALLLAMPLAAQPAPAAPSGAAAPATSPTAPAAASPTRDAAAGSPVPNDPAAIAATAAAMVERAIADGRAAQTEARLRSAIAVLAPAETLRPAERVLYGEVTALLAETLAAQGRFVDAGNSFAEAAKLLFQVLPLEDERTAIAAARARRAWANAYPGLRRTDMSLPMSFPRLLCNFEVTSLASFHEAMQAGTANPFTAHQAECFGKAVAWAQASQGADHPLALDARFERARAELADGASDAAGSDARLAFDGRLRRLGPGHPDTLRAQLLVARLLLVDGRAGEAAELVARVRAAAPPPWIMAEVEALDAERLERMARPAEARPHWQAAVEALAAGSKGQAVADLYRLLAAGVFNARALGECPAGQIDSFRQATAQRRQFDVEWRPEAIDEALAQLLACSGRRAEADKLYRDIAQAWSARGIAFRNIDYAAVQTRRALTLADDPATIRSAEAAAREAAFVARERRFTPDRDAEGNAAGRRIIGATRGGTDPLAAGFAAQLAVAWAWQQHPPPPQGKWDVATPDAQGWQAFRAAQDLAITTAARALLLAAARTAIPDPVLAALAQKRDRLADDAAALDRAALLGTAASDAADRVKVLAAEREAVEREIAAKFPAYAGLVRPDALSVKDVRDRLRPGEALLLIQPAGAYVFAFAVSADRFAWTRAAMTSAEVAASVRSLRCQLTGCDDAVPGRFDTAAAHRLYQALIAPVESALAGAGVVHAVAGGPLAALPLAVLVAKPGSGSDELAALAATEWLGDRYALATLPSVQALRAFTAAAPAWTAPLAGFGDPVLGPPGQDRGPAAATLTRGLASAADIKAMPSLPGTRRELTAIAAAVAAPPDALHLGPAATETAVKRADLGSARTIIFATHALLPRELASVAEPGLVFTPPPSASAADDGILTASEAAALRLDADFVILSACNTAGPDGGGDGEALSGLARAFLYAGARALLASHWPVSDAAGAELTAELLRSRAADAALPRAEALRRAMRAVRTGQTADGRAIAGWTREWADPFFWAPFVLIGSGD